MDDATLVQMLGGGVGGMASQAANAKALRSQMLMKMLMQAESGTAPAVQAAPPNAAAGSMSQSAFGGVPRSQQERALQRQKLMQMLLRRDGAVPAP
jgi:hypothetical protein